MKLSDKELQAFRDSTVDEFPPSKLVSMAAELLAHRAQAETARKSAEEAERLAKRAGELVKTLETIFDLASVSTFTIATCPCKFCKSMRDHASALARVNQDRSLPTGSA